MIFIVSVMVFYQFQILTPVMIILLALLDDLPVMMIAYDNANVTPRPTKWDMQRVMVVSFMLAIVGVIQSSGLLRYLHHDLQVDGNTLQTAMFMQLVIAGHLLLFCTRASKSFFQKPFPEWKLFTAIMGTQVVAALMAANGVFVPKIEWSMIGFIWLYNLVWLFIVDLIKRGLYYMYDNRLEGGTKWMKWHSQPLDPFNGLHRK